MTFFTTPQLIYIIISPIAGIIVLCLLTYLIYQKFYYNKHFDLVCYKKIKNIVNLHDFLLINNFYFKDEENNKYFINHIIFGKKYIYLITRNIYNYSINVASHDASLVGFNKDAQRQYFPNPLLKNINLINKMSSTFSLDKSFFFAINVINDDCKISLSENRKTNYLINLRKLSKVINEFENKEEYELDQQALLKAANKIASKNLNKKDPTGSN